MTFSKAIIARRGFHPALTREVLTCAGHLAVWLLQRRDFKTRLASARIDILSQTRRRIAGQKQLAFVGSRKLTLRNLFSIDNMSAYLEPFINCYLCLTSIRLRIQGAKVSQISDDILNRKSLSATVNATAGQ
jgi:hypothetical protein